MPTYEYRCANGHTFERFQRMTEPPVDTCPECGAAAQRVLSAGAGLLFKGSGFYITDYRSESYKKAAAADSGGDTGGKSEAGATSKPEGGAAKPESGPAKPSSSTGSSSATE
jgi:putative FmdB family regulatory protein